MGHRAQKLPTIIRSRPAILLMTLTIVTVVALRGPSSTNKMLDQVDTARLTYEARAIPELLSWAEIKTLHQDRIQGFIRNPFQFGKKPVDRSPPPPPDEPTGTTPVDEIEPKQEPKAPTTPAFDREYLGYLGPPSRKIAAFRRDGEVHIARVGDVFDGTFIIRRIGYESIDIGFVGHPKEELAKVVLADD